MKVFSLELFIRDCIEIGDSKDCIKESVSLWAKQCEGKTKNEILNDIDKRLLLKDKWFKEV